MADFDISAVLSQLRSLSAQAGGPVAGVTPPLKGVEPGSGGFGSALKGAVEAVNRQQHGAEQAARDFELGRTDLASAMLALQTAQVSFKAMTEVRNRMVRAYQDIMNMPI